MTKTNKIIIATGGTGGHVFPAYSLANYLIKNNYNIELTVDDRGSKYLKDYENLKLIKITSSPLIKKNIFTFLFSIFIILFSTLRSLFFLLFNSNKVLRGEFFVISKFLRAFNAINLLSFLKVITSHTVANKTYIK